MNVLYTFIRLHHRDDDVSENQGPELSATTTALLVLAAIFVALRFTARYTIGNLYGLDDWAMLAALAVAFATGGLNYAMIASGLGRHASTLSLDQQEQFFKLLLAFECVYVTGVALVKISVLLMYLRIFPSRNFRLAATIIGASVVAWCISIVLVCIFQCQPISKAWLPWIDGVCINLKASFIGNAVPNIVSDIAILCMPVFQVLKLQINNTQKATVLFMFLLGSFVLFASIYRFTTIMQFQVTDTTWTLATACTWCVVEVACGAISGCLPTLRPLMSKVSRKFGSLPGTKNLSNGRTGQSSRKTTELVTFGGSGTPGPNASNGQFQRLQDERGYGPTTTITRSQSAGGFTGSSDDERPLNETTIRVQVRREMHVSDNNTDQSQVSYDQKHPEYYGP